MIVQVLLPFLVIGCLTALPIEQDIVLPQVNIIDILNGIGKRGEQDLFSNWQLNYVDENGQQHHVNLSLGRREEQDNILDWAGSIISTIGHFTDNVHITIPWKREEQDWFDGWNIHVDLGALAASLLKLLKKRTEEDISVTVTIREKDLQDWFDNWNINLGGKREEQDNFLDWAGSILSTIGQFTDNVHISIPWKREEEDITFSIDIGKRSEQDLFSNWQLNYVDENGQPHHVNLSLGKREEQDWFDGWNVHFDLGAIAASLLSLLKKRAEEDISVTVTIRETDLQDWFDGWTVNVGKKELQDWFDGWTINVGKKELHDWFDGWTINVGKKELQNWFDNWNINLEGKREEQDNILDWAGSILSTIGHFTDNVHISIPWKRAEEDITISVDIGKRA